MAFIKEESEDMKIEEAFSVKHEDTETQTEMVFIEKESEDMKIEETFRVKDEDTEEQTDLMVLKEESEVLAEMEVKDHYEKIHHDFKNGEKFCETEKTSSQKRAQKTKSNSYFTCHQCGKSFTQKGSLKSHMIGFLSS
ncbi:zinc finger and SCAN domain-containing protein 31-like [Sinocyclocheilus anshuiensis]|uniref:zinc finger and SCAN domain-containing protein 31-like n=1 Tax=Sinocyclocheilus anshuiensis TaxID=1608454 RepID=UPI0007B8E93C|nr:PREDICTED: zinc finger and SCAN domain-containing protein 31-like [Sinocyclocheilus anshuiensis]